VKLKRRAGRKEFGEGIRVAVRNWSTRKEEEKCRKELNLVKATPWNWRWVYEERGRNACCGCFVDVVGKRAVERVVECGRKISAVVRNCSKMRRSAGRKE
jgi:hypothetical protein